VSKASPRGMFFVISSDAIHSPPATGEIKIQFLALLFEFILLTSLMRVDIVGVTEVLK